MWIVLTKPYSVVWWRVCSPLPVQTRADTLDDLHGEYFSSTNTQIQYCQRHNCTLVLQNSNRYNIFLADKKLWVGRFRRQRRNRHKTLFLNHQSCRTPLSEHFQSNRFRPIEPQSTRAVHSGPREFSPTAYCHENRERINASSHRLNLEFPPRTDLS